MNIFVTGTQPKAGKTLIISALASIMQSLCYKTAVYKPIQLGAYEQNSFMVAPDLSFIKQIDPYITTESTYLFKNTYSPVISSELEDIKINPKVIYKDFSLLDKKSDSVIVEGVGELTTPVAPRFTTANLAKMLNTPLVIISEANMESVHNTIMTINHAQTLGIKVNGVILNRYPENNDDYGIKTIPRLIEEYSDTKVVGIIKNIEGKNGITPSMIIDNVLNGVDLEKVFDVKIPKLGI